MVQFCSSSTPRASLKPAMSKTTHTGMLHKSESSRGVSLESSEPHAILMWSKQPQPYETASSDCYTQGCVFVFVVWWVCRAHFSGCQDFCPSRMEMIIQCVQEVESRPPPTASEGSKTKSFLRFFLLFIKFLSSQII